ncbi:MAG: CHAT domain-containing protein [Prochloraceae cyanobacterium]|nr:CHAT domain-containing protein [Prochloraceae cyanobacterium]
MKKISLFTICLLGFYGVFNNCSVLGLKSLPLNIEIFEKTGKKSDLEKEARNLYERGQYLEAISALEEAIVNYTSRGDVVGEVNARRNLALVYQRAGEWEQAKSSIEQSLNRIETIEGIQISKTLEAQSLDVYGQIQLASGKSKQALESWRRSGKIYQAIGDIEGLTRAEINETIALQTLGLYDLARKNLLALQKKLEEKADDLVKVKALESLGNVLRKVGDLNSAETVLQQGLEIARKSEDRNAIAEILLSLGNTARVKQNNDRALSYYQQAIEISASTEIEIEAKLNQFTILSDSGEWWGELVEDIDSKIAQLPPGRTKIYAQINLARNLMKYLDARAQSITTRQTYQLLTSAISLAQKLGDKRAEAYALGNLGRLYEQYQRYEEAQTLTEQATILSQSLNAPDLLYQWEWQLGRIFQQKAQPQKAISAYTQAVNNLQLLRGDLVAISDEVQFTFRESVEPVYRELVNLLLSSDRPTQDNLSQARETIESLQLAQLDNFFREACLDTQPQQIDQIDRKAAVVYSIILPDRLALILSSTEQPLSYYSIPLEEGEEKIGRVIDSLYVRLNPFIVTRDLLKPNQQLYNWLVRPLSAELRRNDIKTLVFVLDGVLRRVPVAALHDGERYVIEKYNLVLTPGLQLLKPRTLSPSNLRAIAAGVIESRQGFPPLPAVENEVRDISQLVPTQVLLNQQFTRDRLEAEIEARPFPIVHLATHGQFSSNAENTFLLAWDGQIEVKDLDLLLRSRERRVRNPIELLILSACQTAKGDRRAALGLAGVAVRSGARSTIASLWSIQDQSTAELMTELYSVLKQPGVNKAEALRNAQLSLLNSNRYKHPYYWAAFVLVGNWF